jgi:hypothetical protein
MSPNAATQAIVIKRRSECIAAVLVDHKEAYLKAERQLQRLRTSHFEEVKQFYRDQDAYDHDFPWWTTTLNLL